MCYKEAMILCKLGKYFNDDQPTWWWLTEEFYAKAVEAGSRCTTDGGKSEAICRYVFGTFLLDYSTYESFAKYISFVDLKFL